MAYIRVNHTGKKFGRLRVLGEANSSGSNHYVGASWLCVCECGEERVCRGSALSEDRTVECARCAAIKKPYSLQASPAGISRLTQAMKNAKAPMTRQQLASSVDMTEHQLYDCIAVLHDNQRLKLGYADEERTYALAA